MLLNLVVPVHICLWGVYVGLGQLWNSSAEEMSQLFCWVQLLLILSAFSQDSDGTLALEGEATLE